MRRSSDLSGGPRGSLIVYLGVPRRPRADEILIGEEFAELASVALEIHDAQEERRVTAERIANLTANVPGMVFQWTLDEIGRAHVRTPVTNAHLVCRPLLEKKKP